MTQTNESESRRRRRIGKGTIYLAAAALGVGAFAWFSGPPRPSTAAGPDGYVLYGIQPSSGDLVRYDFTGSTLSTVGSVSHSLQGTLTGIEASAYFPGFSNIFGFWTDPSDELTKLAYISTTTGAASIVGTDLGPERITGACAVHPAGTMSYDVYALQESDVIPFTIDNTGTGTVAGEVVPDDPTAARITVLGAAISYGGQYEIPVTVRVMTGGTTTDPFGNANLPVDGNVNDDQNPRAYIFPSDLAAGTDINIGAKSWIKTDSMLDGSLNSHWMADMAVDTTQATNNVIVLRNGDPAPQITGFLDQASVPDYLGDYIDSNTNTMLLGESQAIYLFELGSTVSVDPMAQPESLTAAQDFQDLVVLVTMNPEAQELNTGTITTGAISGSMNLNPNNSENFVFELVKPDTSKITRDDLLNATTADLDANGVYYSGSATKIRVKPRGNGAQNTILIDGVPYTLKNNTTYTFTAPNMTVSLQHDTAVGSIVTHRDEFNSVSYDNNDGTDDWASSWGPDTSDETGTRRVESGRVRIDNTDGSDATGEYLERSADLSSATTATFSFDYMGYGWGGQDTFAVEVSDDGGANWTQLENINVNSLGVYDSNTATTTYMPVSEIRTYQLADYISLTANVKVRFILIQGFGASNQYITFDNVQIEHNGGGAAPNSPVSMGGWGLTITTTGDLTDGDPGDDPTKASQLIHVDHKTGSFTQMMQLSLPYDGLASTDGQTFYAVSGKKVYKIDTAAQTETLLKDHLAGDYRALGFAGSAMQSFGVITDSVVELDTTTGNVNGIPVGMGVADLGTIVFTPASKDPGNKGQNGFD